MAAQSCVSVMRFPTDLETLQLKLRLVVVEMRREVL